MGDFSLASAKERHDPRHPGRCGTDLSVSPTRPFVFTDATTQESTNGESLPLHSTINPERSQKGRPPPKKQSPATPELIRLLAMSDESVPLAHAIGEPASGSYSYAMYRFWIPQDEAPPSLRRHQFHVANPKINHSSLEILESDTVTLTSKTRRT
jgi:hypothetical protein